MTKKDIVRSIADSLTVSQVQTKVIVQKTFDAIIESLIEGGRVELRNFGVFEVRCRKPRNARNPKTGKAIKVPAKRVVTFKPGKVMEAKVAALVKAKKKKADGTKPPF